MNKISSIFLAATICLLSVESRILLTPLEYDEPVESPVERFHDFVDPVPLFDEPAKVASKVPIVKEVVSKVPSSVPVDFSGRFPKPGFFPAIKAGNANTGGINLPPIIGNIISSIMDAVQNLLGGLLPTVKEAVDKALQLIGTFTSNFAGDCIPNIIAALSTIPDTVLQTVGTCIAPAIATATQVITTNLAKLGEVFMPLEELAACIVDPIACVASLPKYISKIATLPGTLINIVASILSCVPEILTKLGTCVKEIISQGIGDVFGLIEQATQCMK